MIAYSPSDPLFLQAMRQAEDLFRYQNGHGTVASKAELADDYMRGTVCICQYIQPEEKAAVAQWLLTGNDKSVFWLFYSPTMEVLERIEKAAKTAFLTHSYTVH